MRLSSSEITAIKETTVRHFGADATVRVFGSRVDDERRGGDIDLLIECSLLDAAAVIRAEIAFLADLKQRLNERKIDLLVDFPTRSSRPEVFGVARAQGIPL